MALQAVVDETLSLTNHENSTSAQSPLHPKCRKGFKLDIRVATFTTPTVGHRSENLNCPLTKLFNSLSTLG